MRKRGSIALVTLLLLFSAVPLAQADSDEPEEDVTTYTVSRIPLDNDDDD